MTTAQFIGTALIGAGALDCVVAVAVLGPRLSSSAPRRMVVAGMISGGVVVALVGVAFLLGVFPGLDDG